MQKGFTHQKNHVKRNDYNENCSNFALRKANRPHNTMKHTFKTIALLPLIALAACDNAGTTDNATEADSIATDTEKEAVMSLPQSNGRMVTGIAVDGAKRSVVLKQGADTVFYDLPPIDFAWEIGDTLTLTIVTTSNGDSITAVELGNPAAADMAKK